MAGFNTLTVDFEIDTNAVLATMCVALENNQFYIYNFSKLPNKHELSSMFYAYVFNREYG